MTILTFLENLLVAFELFCSDCDAIFQVNVLTFKMCFVIASVSIKVFFELCACIDEVCQIFRKTKFPDQRPFFIKDI